MSLRPCQWRFSQTDPSRMEMNPYQYAAGNPIRFVDPSGTLCLDPTSSTGINVNRGGGSGPDRGDRVDLHHSAASLLTEQRKGHLLVRAA
jgi:hypothetical protein